MKREKNAFTGEKGGRRHLKSCKDVPNEGQRFCTSQWGKKQKKDGETWIDANMGQRRGKGGYRERKTELPTRNFRIKKNDSTIVSGQGERSEKTWKAKAPSRKQGRYHSSIGVVRAGTHRPKVPQVPRGKQRLRGVGEKHRKKKNWNEKKGGQSRQKLEERSDMDSGTLASKKFCLC